MDVRTGKIHSAESMAALMALAGSLPSGLVPMELPPTARQLRRMRVGKYDPCPCGSGKKFKFCCYIGNEQGRTKDER